MNVHRGENMTCGHCVGTIEKAIRAVDPTATVAVDGSSRLASIEGNRVDAIRLTGAKADAGLPTAVVGVETRAANVDVAPRRGCCCG